MNDAALLAKITALENRIRFLEGNRGWTQPGKGGIGNGLVVAQVKTQQAISAFGGTTVYGIVAVSGTPTPTTAWVPGNTITDAGIGWASIVGGADVLIACIGNIGSIYGSYVSLGQKITLAGSGFSINAYVVVA